MAILSLVHEPDDRLRQVSQSITVIDDGIKKLVQDMHDTMKDASGCGLAAVQVGVLKRLLIVDEALCMGTEKQRGSDAPLVVINPEITWSSPEQRTFDEGCLSLLGIRVPVTRPKRIRLSFQTLSGQEEREMDGLLSTCVQHEMDHLNGILTIDYLEKEAQQEAIKKLTALKESHQRMPESTLSNA